MEQNVNNSNKIKTTIAMFSNFSPLSLEKQSCGSVIYFLESHTENPEDRENFQAVSDFLQRFDMSSYEKYEVHTGYLSRYNYMPKDIDQLTPKELEESIRKGKEEQDNWLKRCGPYLPGFIRKGWQDCISKDKNVYYEECKKLIIDELAKNKDFSAAFLKSVKSYTERNQTNHKNGELYVLEEISWILSLPLMHLNKQIYLIHAGNNGPVIKNMFSSFPNFGKAVKLISPRFSEASFRNVADFTIYYNVNEYAGCSYALTDAGTNISNLFATFKKNSNSKAVISLSKTSEPLDISMVKYVIEALPCHLYWLNRDNVYIGCNESQARDFGLKSRDEVLGKTNYDFFEPDVASSFDRNNNIVMETGEPYEAEEPVGIGGKKGRCLSQKVPVFDIHGKVVGMLGISFDITERKKVEEMERKAEIQEIKLKAQKEFEIFTAQILHDIVSPLNGLDFLVKFPDIPEKYSTILKQTLDSVKNIVRALKDKYKEYEREVRVADEINILVPLALEEAVRGKQYQTKGLKAKAVINYSFDRENRFVFINGDQMSFSRMMSNLMNNAIEACNKESAVIDVLFGVENNNVKIVMKDNGIGMPKEIIEKIKNHQLGNFDSTKHVGSGNGLNQILTTIDYYKGSLDIESTDSGTTFFIEFPLADVPKWVAQEIPLKKDDIVVVLNDNPKELTVFEDIFREYSKDIALNLFSVGRDAIAFIDSIEDKGNIFFISSYELKNSDLNGLVMILQSKVKRSLVMTSVYSDKDLQSMAERSNIKILLKQFLSDTPVKIVD